MDDNEEQGRLNVLVLLVLLAASWGLVFAVLWALATVWDLVVR